MSAVDLSNVLIDGDYGTRQPEHFDGLGMSMGNLARLSKAKTRPISAENFNGEKGQGDRATRGTGANASRDLGQGWKVSPSVSLKAASILRLQKSPGRARSSIFGLPPTRLTAVI